MPFDLSVIHQKNLSSPKQFSTIEPMTPQAAQIAARSLVQRGISRSLDRIIALLLSAGVLPQQRLPASGRALRKYHTRRILDRLPFTSAEVRTALQSYGLPMPEAERSLLYTLGPVGIEIMRERHGFPPPGGYLSAPLERVLHDLVVNEIVFYLGEAAMAAGWTPVWSSKYESSLWKDKKEAVILEPDAFLRFKKDSQEQVYLIAYHNEDKRTRAMSKVRRYEAACQQDKLWFEQWEVETFPPVLAVYRDGIVGKGYQEEIKDNPGQVRFYGRSLEGFFQDSGAWYDFQRNEKVKPFPCVYEEK